MFRLFVAILAAASIATAAWFEPNRGQAANDVLFLCKLPGASVELLRTGSRLNSSAGTIVMSWESAMPSSVAASYESVTYRDLYPGIDQVFHPGANALEYDFIVRPNADLSRIRLRIDGARRAGIDGAGSLVAQLGSGQVRQPKPLLYQQTASGRREIAGRWVRLSESEFGFQAADYDHKTALIVDPELIYSTYLQQNVAPQALASGPAGNIYVAGSYWFDPFTYSHPGGYVAKLNADGTAYEYITYLSGSGYASISAIALDGEGNAYVTGTEDSPDFPITGTGVLGVPVVASSNASKAFVAKIDPQGLIVYSDTIGGPVSTGGSAIAVTPQGRLLSAASPKRPGFRSRPERIR